MRGAVKKKKKKCYILEKEISLIAKLRHKYGQVNYTIESEKRNKSEKKSK